MKIPEPRKLKSGNYFIQLRLNGVSVPVTAPTAKDCKIQAELIKAEYRSGKRSIHNKADSLTLSEVMRLYIDSRKKVLSPSTIKSYTSVMKHRFTAYQDKPVLTITDWQSVINDEVSDGVSAKTIKNAWSLVAASLDRAGYPVPSVKLPQIVPSSRPWLTAEQIETFVDAVKGKPCEVPALLALHSLRRSEILGLTWDKIDLKKNLIYIDGSAVINTDNQLVYRKANKTKNSHRTIPIMIPSLHTALSKTPLEKRTGRVVTTCPSHLYDQINAICRKNGLPMVGIHGLRHSFASLAYHVGMSERAAMLIGGWEDIQTMHKIYTHISNADILTAENLMTQFYKR